WKIFWAAMMRPEGTLLESGYAGNGAWKNDPEATNIHDHGPLPAGLYFIGTPHDDIKVGEFAMALTPDPGNVMFGRFGFFIHGDSEDHPGQASDGCIVLSRWAREAIAASDDKDLLVVP